MATTDTLILATDITNSQTVAVTLDGKNILICNANGCLLYTSDAADE